jgi:predicted DNA binding CopG/RHH family protein
MSKSTISYTKGEIGKIRVVDDFLPSPDELVLREDSVKVTLSLSRQSVDFFKREARARHVPYQRMIRALVDVYARRSGSGKLKQRP